MNSIAHLLELALQQHHAGQLAEAEQRYQAVLQQHPNQPNALYFLGLLAHQVGNLEAAIAYYQSALTVRPNYIDAHNNLGAALQQQGKLEDAISHYQAALRLQPSNANALVNLGVTLQQQGRLEAAIGRFQKALQVNPDLPEVHTNLGHAFKQQGEMTQAIAHYQTAVQLLPQHPEAYVDLGDALVEQGEIEAAIVQYDQALTLKPDHVTAKGSRIRALLISGNLRDGFAEYDPWRLSLSNRGRSFTQPNWDGSDLNGKVILLYAEPGTGLGDTLQFVRYVPLVAQRGGKVILACQEPLLRLLRRVAGVEKVVVMGESLPMFDVQAALLSLPHAFGTTLDTIPDSVPYLVASKRHCFLLSAPIEPCLKVGLVWGGNPEHTHDRDRSCPLSAFQPILTTPQVAFYSLQKGPHRTALTALPESSIQDLNDRLGDFADTATAIAQLDLVITVDTAVAHLAGAMGKPVWILLSFAPDWRWLMQRNDSPWYPTARLFRQTRRQDWDGVCHQVAVVLRTLATQAGSECYSGGYPSGVLPIGS